MDAVTVADRPSEGEGNQVAVQKRVGKGRGVRNVTKATADVSKPKQAKGEGWWEGGVWKGRGKKYEGGRKGEKKRVGSERRKKGREERNKREIQSGNKE